MHLTRRRRPPASPPRHGPRCGQSLLSTCAVCAAGAENLAWLARQDRRHAQPVLDGLRRLAELEGDALAAAILPALGPSIGRVLAAMGGGRHHG